MLRGRRERNRVERHQAHRRLVVRILQMMEEFRQGPANFIVLTAGTINFVRAVFHALVARYLVGYNEAMWIIIEALEDGGVVFGTAYNAVSWVNRYIANSAFGDQQIEDQAAAIYREIGPVYRRARIHEDAEEEEKFDEGGILTGDQIAVFDYVGNILPGGVLNDAPMVDTSRALVVWSKPPIKTEMFAWGQPIVKYKDIDLTFAAKGGKNGDKVDLDSIVYTKHYVSNFSARFTSPINKKSFRQLDGYKVNTPTADAAGSLSVIALTARAMAHLNSVSQLVVAANDMATATQFGWTDGTNNIRKQFAYPRYNATTFQVDDANDGNVKCCLSKQSINLRMKNVSQKVAGTSPIVGYIHVFQVKQDVHQNVSLTGDLVVEQFVSNGFKQEFDSSTASSTIPSSVDQDLHINLEENVFVGDYLKRLSCRKFGLIAGQELMINVKMPQQQILSYQFLLRNTVADIGTPNTFAPVVMKKGEIFLMIEFFGGLGATSDNSGVAVEDTDLAVWVTNQYDFSLLSMDADKRKYNFAQTIPGGTINNDVDYDLS